MIKRTFDIGEINSVLKHNDIWPLISDDDTNIDDFMPPIDDNIHYLHDTGVLYILHPMGNDWKIHANVIKENRSKAVEAGNEALRYGFEEIGADRIVASIPTEYSNVYGFTMKFGFSDEGVSDGEHILSLRAKQWAS